jgi:hypothetical protein
MSNIEEKNDSPELKKGQVKHILISEFQKSLPRFEYLEYKNGCYTFERISKTNVPKIFEHFHIVSSTKERSFSCSVASRINRSYLNSYSYNTGLINPHIDLIVLKKGTGVNPQEEACYFHNGQVNTTVKIIQQIVKDFKSYGEPFLEKQRKQFEKSNLLKVGFDFIGKLDVNKQSFKLELENSLKMGGHLISNIKNKTYLKLKSELQNVTGVDRETRKNIPKLSYELLDFYCYQ